MQSGNSLRILTLFLLLLSSAAACKDTSGPAVAVTLKLYTVDGNPMPVQMRDPHGRLVTVATGFLQGTNWGAACGFAAGLAEGPLTSVDVADCRLKKGEERTFQITFSDTRFPTGAHTYRFIPID